MPVSVTPGSHIVMSMSHIIVQSPESISMGGNSKFGQCGLGVTDAAGLYVYSTEFTEFSNTGIVGVGSINSFWSLPPIPTPQPDNIIFADDLYFIIPVYHLPQSSAVNVTSNGVNIPCNVNWDSLYCDLTSLATKRRSLILPEGPLFVNITAPSFNFQDFPVGIYVGVFKLDAGVQPQLTNLATSLTLKAEGLSQFLVDNAVFIFGTLDFDGREYEASKTGLSFSDTELTLQLQPVLEGLNYTLPPGELYVKMMAFGRTQQADLGLVHLVPELTAGTEFKDDTQLRGVLCVIRETDPMRGLGNTNFLNFPSNDTLRQKYMDDMSLELEHEDGRPVTEFTVSIIPPIQSCTGIRIRLDPSPDKQLFNIYGRFKFQGIPSNRVYLGQTASFTDLYVGYIVGFGVALIVIIAIVIFVIKRCSYQMAYNRAKLDLSQVDEDVKDLTLTIKSSDLDIIKKLGEGSFGAVYLATWKGQFVAVKKMAFAVLENQINDFFREAMLTMAIPNHPNVIKVHGMCQEIGNLCLVMQFCANGSLDSHLKSLRTPSSAEPLDTEIELELGEVEQMTLMSRYLIILGIAEGMKHLAANNIVHRDLAARNILLESSGNPVIADFGFSRQLGGNSDSGKTSSTIGPVRWMAPECISQQEYSEKSDVWSFGCIVYEIFSGGNLPFEDLEIFEVATQVKGGGHVKMPQTSPKYVHQLEKMIFKVDPEKRPTFAELVTFLEGVQY